MDEDWRVDNARELAGQPLRRKKWTRWSQEWDHDHCMGCMIKFAEFEGDYVLTNAEGYTTIESHENGPDYYWVCPTCFHQLKPKLGWHEVS